MRFLKHLSQLGMLILIVIGTAWFSATNDDVVFFFEELTEYLEHGADSEQAANDAKWKAAPEIKKSVSNTQFEDIKTSESVVEYNPNIAYDGITFYTDYSNTAFLINMKGDILHKWKKTFSELWPEPKHVDKKFYGENLAAISESHLFPNGDILVLYSRPGISPWGGGLAKIDKNSKTIWTYDEKVHHWLDVAPDGKIYALEHKLHEKRRHMYPGFYKKPYLEDYVSIIDSETGKNLKRIALHNAIENSRYNVLFEMGLKKYGNTDVLHTNDIDYITEDMAQHLPFAKAGQALLSFHRMSTIAILDIESEKIVWAQSGMWNGQHDPDILPNGKVSLIQNRSENLEDKKLMRQKEYEITQILEFDPLTKEVTWEFYGPEDDIFHTKVRGEIFHLPNGNILFTEHNNGRIIEITRDKQIAWQFVNYKSKDKSHVSGLNATARYQMSDLPFLQDKAKAN